MNDNKVACVYIIIYRNKLSLIPFFHIWFLQMLVHVYGMEPQYLALKWGDNDIIW